METISQQTPENLHELSLKTTRLQIIKLLFILVRLERKEEKTFFY